MTTTTSYGTWVTVTNSPYLTLRQDVEAFTGEYGGDYDVDAIERDYRAAINAALPGGVTLAGEEFYGPVPVDNAATDAIAPAIDEVDFWAIVQRHDKAAAAERAAAVDELSALGQEMNPDGYR